MLTRTGAVAFAIALVGAPSATAQTPEPLGFGIQAVGFPGGFRFEAKPGDTVHGRVLLTNTTTTGKVVNFAAADALTGAMGGLDFGQPGKRPKAAGRWVRLGTKQVNLPGSGALEVPFVVRVKRNARSGDHVAGVLAYGPPPKVQQTKDSQFRLRLVSRVALPITVTVPGPRNPALELIDAQVETAPTGAFVGLKLGNTGNTLIQHTRGKVAIFKDGKRLVRQRIQLDSFVPATQITYPVPWSGRPVEGDYQVRGYLKPEGAPRISLDRDIEFSGDKIEEYRRETGRPATSTGTSPLLYAAFVLALLVALVLGFAYFRLLRRTR